LTVTGLASPAAIGRVLSVVGLLILCGLLFEFGISGLVAQQAQDGLLATFKQEVRTTQLGLSTVNPPEGTPVALLRIPRLALDRIVIEGSTPDDLKSGPGHLLVSPMPGEFGNSVILGRRTTYGGPLHDLNRLQPHDQISVTTGQGTFTYVVQTVSRVAAGDVDPLQGTLDSRLTLITSDPPYLFNGRLVVVAMLQGQPLEVATRNPPTIAASDLGLAANPAWFAPALLLTQLLAGAIWVSGRLRRRYWPASVTYMFAVPVIAALTLATVVILDRGLPGTL
jgi:sortase A